MPDIITSSAVRNFMQAPNTPAMATAVNLGTGNDAQFAGLKLANPNYPLFSVQFSKTDSSFYYYYGGAVRGISGMYGHRLETTANISWSSGQNPNLTVDVSMQRAGAGLLSFTNPGAGAGVRADIAVRTVIQQPPVSAVPAANGDLVFEATSNTSLTVKYKGTDGVVRSAVLTLA